MSKAKRSAKSTKPRKSPTGDYPVGYCRPPEATQFKPGQSGLPTGRPKGAKNTDTLAREILNRRITIREGDKERKVSVREGMLTRFAERALKGDVKAAEFLLKLDRQVAEGSSEGDALDANDREILDALMRELEAKRQEDDKEKPDAK